MLRKKFPPSRALNDRKGVRTISRKSPFLRLASILAMFLVVPAFLFYLGILQETTVDSSGKAAMMDLVNTPHKNISRTSMVKSSRITVAYAVSLIKCGDHQGSSENLGDGALILRHSIHQNSIRNPDSGSRYDYKMYAIVHEQAEICSAAFRNAGYEILVKPQPVQKEEIRGEYLKQHIHKERCCGAQEFVKLYAYKIDAPLVVHLDMDFILTKPMDSLFDAMLDPMNEKARDYIHREFPDKPWPKQIDAMFTKDWPQVRPGRIAAYQAGFVVLRPNHVVFDEIVEIIKEGNYTGGFGRDNGWGGLGYGGFVGAMAMQGLISYYYDQFRPETYVELNQCRYNHMGMDVRFRGKCRNGQNSCEDCQETPIGDIYSIHYTMCRKPWLCIGEGSKTMGKSKDTLHEDILRVDHCLELAREWHKLRIDLEDKLLAISGDKSILEGRQGKYKSEYFLGHCKASKEYLSIQGRADTLKRIPDLYK